MNRFEVITPADVASASRLLAEDGNVAFAGGVDVVDLSKQSIVSPAALVNLKGLKELGGIEMRPSGDLRLGATVKLSEVAEHPAIRAKFTAIAEAAGEAATPQIRNLGTVGGNILQRPRCWYFRNPDVNCLKKGGDTCYSIGGLQSLPRDPRRRSVVHRASVESCARADCNARERDDRRPGRDSAASSWKSSSRCRQSIRSAKIL